MCPLGKRATNAVVVSQQGLLLREEFIARKLPISHSQERQRDGEGELLVSACMGRIYRGCSF